MGAKLTTFSGVMVPSILAILGAVMYLIVPQVLGGVGLISILGIILLAHSITIATAFSISSISTNIIVKGGGLYYLISRSLGRAFGGSMGIQLFLAQTVAAAFYTIAFTRIANVLLQSIGLFFPEKYLAMFFMLLFFAITFRGAQFVIKIQYAILTVIVLSLITIFLAPVVPGAIDANLTGLGSIPFWIAFALFFPAVTGIDAGVGMSGELADPRKALVRGTFGSILITMTVYILLVIKLAYSATPELLTTDPFIIKTISIVPAIIILGILTATISSALSCLMTAPRSLRAMTKDKIFPRFLSFLKKSIGLSSEPHYALILSLIIAELVIFLGGLELVSIVVSMFFLNVYGWINGAAFLEKVSKNPSFRPTFNAPWPISLYGMIACYVVMYLFSPYVMIAGILFQVILFYLLAKTRSSVRIESVWEGVLFQLFRSILRRIEENYKGRKNWRPTIISFSTQEKNRNLMITLIDNISSNRSIMKLYVMLKSGDKHKTDLTLQNYVKENELDIFPRSVLTRDVVESMETLIQAETLGRMPMNTVLVDYDTKLPLERLATLCDEEKKNFLMLRNHSGITNHRQIDVWWGSSHNGNLMIMLAHLVTYSKRWRNNNPIIRIISVVDDKKELSSTKDKIHRMIDKSRMDNIELYVKIKTGTIQDMIYEESKIADLVIIGLTKIKGKFTQEGMKKVDLLTKRLNASIIVSSHGEINFDMN